MNILTFESTSLRDTERVAKTLLNDLTKKKFPHATIVALSGPLGAGKTSFIKAAASFFGVPKKSVTSPTFVLIKRYRTKKHTSLFSYFYHADAYRIEHDEEFLSLGFKQIIQDPNSIFFIEWAENIKKILPKEKIVVLISYKKEKNARRITIKNYPLR